MGLSPIKLILILGVISILFLPTLLRRAANLPQQLELLRARLSGEEEPEQATPLRAGPDRAPSPSRAERLGTGVARVRDGVRRMLASRSSRS